MPAATRSQPPILLPVLRPTTPPALGVLLGGVDPSNAPVFHGTPSGTSWGVSGRGGTAQHDAPAPGEEVYLMAQEPTRSRRRRHEAAQGADHD